MARRVDLVVACLAAVATTVTAEASPLSPAPAKPAGRSPPPLVLELHSGWKDPLGAAGLSLVFDRAGRFSGGVGLGLEHWSQESLPVVGLFGRARLVRLGPVWLGTAATLSRVHAKIDRQYDRPPTGAYVTDNVHWWWQPGYRASAALGAELTGERWSARLEGGAGYLLNDPRCTYDNGVVYASTCDSRDFPAAYRLQVQPGRVMASVTASLGYRFGIDTPSQAPPHEPPRTAPALPSSPPPPPTRKSPETAFQLSFASTVAPMALGLGILAASSLRSDASVATSLIAISAGITIGPSVGHVYTGEYVRAGGLALARLAGLFVGSLVILKATVRGDCDDGPPGSCNVPGEQVVLGVALLFSVPVLAVYDIAKAPDSARRANERNRLVDLGIVPTVIASGPTPGRGLALAGRF